MRALSIFLLGLATILHFTASTTHATPISCQPQPADPPGDCSGTMSYSATDATHATLSFTLTNDSDPAFGGFLTALAFNNPSNKILTVGEDPSFPANFNVLLHNDTINGMPLGKFDILVTTDRSPGDNSFEGSGPPSKGIAAGASATFMLALTGTGLDTIDNTDFLGTFSVDASEGGNIWGAVRFRGFSSDAPGGRSDKDPLAALVPTVTQVPAPMSLLLVGLGVISLGSLVRRKMVGPKAR
jgi:hypothetical protein